MKNKKKHNDKSRIQQEFPADSREPNKIAASTHYDFRGKQLTPYGGLFPVATMLEKLGFQNLVAETLTVKRIPRVMTIYQFVLGMVLALYMGFARLNHIRFVAQDPMLTGILKVSELPGQSTFWRFLASLHLNVAGQLLQLQRILRERVWEAGHPPLVIDMPVCTCDGVMLIDDVSSESFQALSDLIAMLGVPDRDTNVASVVRKMVTNYCAVPSSTIDDFCESSHGIGF